MSVTETKSNTVIIKFHDAIASDVYQAIVSEGKSADPVARALLDTFKDCAVNLVPLSGARQHDFSQVLTNALAISGEGVNPAAVSQALRPVENIVYRIQ